MTPRSALRVTGAWWFVPLVLASSVYLSLSNTSGIGDYPVNRLAAASFQVAYTGPLTAAYVAFAFERRTRLLVDMRPVRSGVVVAARTWGWVLLGAPLASATGMLVATGLVPRRPAEWDVLVVTVAAALACSGVGVLFGRALPPVVAVPGAAVITFAFLALPDAGLDVLLRNLDSDFGGCCAPDQQPATAMVTGSLAVTSVVVVGAVVALVAPTWRRRRRLVSAVLACAVLAIAAGSGVVVARTVAASSGQPLTLLGVQRRSDPLTCSRVPDVEVCVWPEHTPYAADVERALTTLNVQLSSQGIPTIARASEDPEDRSAVQLSPGATPLGADVLTYSLVSGYPRSLSGCADTATPYDVPVATALVGLEAGLGPDDLTAHGISPDDVATAQQVADSASPQRELAWLHEVVCEPGTGS